MHTKYITYSKQREEGQHLHINAPLFFPPHSNSNSSITYVQYTSGGIGTV